MPVTKHFPKPKSRITAAVSCPDCGDEIGFDVKLTVRASAEKFDGMYAVDIEAEPVNAAKVAHDHAAVCRGAT